ncbi:MAG: hypothetical protein ACKO40_16120 [Planctomycetaceae bacterium]
MNRMPVIGADRVGSTWWQLTRADLAMCSLPVVAFLSIVSLV